MELPDFGPGIGVTDGLVDPARADLEVSKGLGCERASLFFRQSQDRVGHLCVQFLKTCKFRSFGLIQPQEWELEGFGEGGHEKIDALSCNALQNKVASPA